MKPKEGPHTSAIPTPAQHQDRTSTPEERAASTKSQNSKTLRFLIYRDIKSRSYWIDLGDRYTCVNKPLLTICLRADGFSSRREPGQSLSPLNAEIRRSQTENWVDRAIPDHPDLGRGVHVINGERILVLRNRHTTGGTDFKQKEETAL